MKYTLKKLNEVTMNNILGKHSDAGYIIISASRGDKTHTENKINSKKLMNKIKLSGYSYTQVWGGFYEITTDTVVKEKSYIVFNFKGKEIQEDSVDLNKLGLKLVKLFNQDSYFYKEEGEDGVGYYITQDNKIEAKFNNVRPTKAADIYFTKLSRNWKKQTKITKSLTFESKDNASNLEYEKGIIYMAILPQTLAEAYKRKGELFIKI